MLTRREVRHILVAKRFEDVDFESQGVVLGGFDGRRDLRVKNRFGSDSQPNGLPFGHRPVGRSVEGQLEVLRIHPSLAAIVANMRFQEVHRR